MQLFEENRKASNREKEGDGYFLQKIGMPGNKIIGADCGLKVVLENIIERALILCKGDTITMDAFPFRDERAVAAVQQETDDIPPLDEIVSPISRGRC
jgi:hypothetical protein